MEMPKMDTETKQYMSRPAIFADVFNYLIYKGRQVIKPEALSSVDTTELAVPYGNNARVPVQKHRDNMKQWITSMQDGKAVYVLLGCENQSEIHYAMPVRNMLYDAINYANQVKALADMHKEKKDLKNAEFLSGLTIDDKIKPVITIVLYWKNDEWIAPTKLSEMFTNLPGTLGKFINDYSINLITPHDIKDFSKLKTELGDVLEFIKRQDEDKLLFCIQSERGDDWSMSVESINIINEFTGAGIRIDETEGGKVKMCRATESIREEGEQKKSREIAESLVKNGVPLDKIIASIPDIPEDEIQKIFNNITKKS
jgi:hypothetical protein